MNFRISTRYLGRERKAEMKKATVELFQRVFSVLKPPPDMTLSQWGGRIPGIAARRFRLAGPLENGQRPLSAGDHGRDHGHNGSKSGDYVRRADRENRRFYSESDWLFYPL